MKHPAWKVTLFHTELIIALFLSVAALLYSLLCFSWYVFPDNAAPLLGFNSTVVSPALIGITAFIIMFLCFEALPRRRAEARLAQHDLLLQDLTEALRQAFTLLFERHALQLSGAENSAAYMQNLDMQIKQASKKVSTITHQLHIDIGDELEQLIAKQAHVATQLKLNDVIYTQKESQLTEIIDSLVALEGTRRKTQSLNELLRDTKRKMAELGLDSKSAQLKTVAE